MINTTLVSNHHDKVHINEDVNGAMRTFLGTLLTGIKEEIDIVSNAFYNYDDQPNALKGVDNLFAIIERTWMGIFNNAIVRKFPDVATLQEFNVWNSERNTGRCDFLFCMKDDDGYFDIVTEAKMREFKNDWKQVERERDFEKIISQAYAYYKEEEIYYKKPVKLMALVFEWVREERIEAAKGIMDNIDREIAKDFDFLSLYYGDRRGVFIYGKIIAARDFGIKSNGVSEN